MLALWLALGCAAPTCGADPAEVLAQSGADALTCGERDEALAGLALLAGRPLPAGTAGSAHDALLAAWRADPSATEAGLRALSARRTSLAQLSGFYAAKERSNALWGALHGGDLPALSAPLRAAAAPWAEDDEAHLVLSEADIEGWILYASLCREVQGAGPARLSVSDRVQVYRMLQERWRDATPDARVAMVSLGAFWPEIRDAWEAAPWQLQQAWIADAPLPPPMTASSLGYVETMLHGDLLAHAEVLHRTLGPLSLSAP